MPPKLKVTKEKVLEAAFELVRERGADALNARAVAKRLDCSTQPVFSNFSSMEELRDSVIARTERAFEDFTRQAMEQDKFPPYKASGMAYIMFAKKERELFKLLFMRDRSREPGSAASAFFENIVALVSENTGLSLEAARLLHLEMWVWVHGAASMAVSSYLDLDEEAAGAMLTDVYQGLAERWKKKEGEKNV